MSIGATQHVTATFDIARWRQSPHCVRLRRVGLKPTRQRVEIAERLFGNIHRHVTAEALYSELRVNRYPPSLATIYNTLRGLSDGGLLREVAVYGSVSWFDTNIGDHYHYYISDTQKLIDIPPEHIPTLPISGPAGTRVVGIDVIIRVAHKVRTQPVCHRSRA